ncbi:MAG: PQQ-binding-like beta-propeller repeat protein [Gemmataceae bacterium]
MRISMLQLSAQSAANETCRGFRDLLLVLFGILVSLSVTTTVEADDWPQWLGPKRDGVWREEGILKKFPKNGPKVLWRHKIGAGYSGPAVANGLVYITDRLLGENEKNPASPFTTPVVGGVERVICLDEKTGKQKWMYEYPCPYKVSYAAGPRTTPVVDSGKVYTLGTMGDLYCFDAKTGKKLWHRDLLKDYAKAAPRWGFSGHPLVDGDRLICLVGGAGSVAVAFDKNTGKEIWKNLSAAEPGYAPPMIYEIAGKRQLIIWDANRVNGLNPKTGELYWSRSFLPDGEALRAGMSIPTPRLDGRKIFVSCFYNGSLMLKVNETGTDTSVVWQRAAAGRGRVDPRPRVTKSLHSVMVTPWIIGDHIYGIGSYGELRCLEKKTGKRVWSNLKVAGSLSGKPNRWGTAFIVKNDDRFFLFNEHGELIIAKFSPEGYEEIDRVKLLKATNVMASFRGVKRLVVWSHPAFANGCIFARNDREIIRVSLKADQ